MESTCRKEEVWRGRSQVEAKEEIGVFAKQYQRYRRQRPSIKEKPTTPPDLVVDVTLPNGQSGEIEVRAGDNARDLAERYVYKTSCVCASFLY